MGKNIVPYFTGYKAIRNKGRTPELKKKTNDFST
jgi:hypothetical protein